MDICSSKVTYDAWTNQRRTMFKKFTTELKVTKFTHNLKCLHFVT